VKKRPPARPPTASVPEQRADEPTDRRTTGRAEPEQAPVPDRSAQLLAYLRLMSSDAGFVDRQAYRRGYEAGRLAGVAADEDDRDVGDEADEGDEQADFHDDGYDEPDDGYDGYDEYDGHDGYDDEPADGFDGYDEVGGYVQDGVYVEYHRYEGDDGGGSSGFEDDEYAEAYPYEPEDADRREDDEAVTRDRQDTTYRWAVVAVVAAVLLLLVAGLVAVLRSRPDAQPAAGVDPSPLRAPDGLPARGSLIETSVEKDGSLVVGQWVRPPRSLKAIRLMVPEVPGAARARVEDLRVTVDGTVLHRGVALDSSGVLVSLARPATMVGFRYRVLGASVLSPSKPGRALANVTPLIVDASAPGRRVVRVRGTVLSAACAEPGEVESRPCGAPTGGTWTVELRGAHRRDQVVAQVDLPG
jgi:hypothetical protein